MKLALLILANLWLIAGVNADINYSNAVKPVYYLGSHEFGGAFEVTCQGNAFSSASPDTPVFMEISFERGAVMAHTMVNLASDDPALNQPIYLPLALESRSIFGQPSLAASADTVSIVRWVEGESTVWLRIQTSSSNWVQFDENTTGPPTVENSVSWHLGVSAQFYAQWLEARDANIPFPTRNLQASSTDYHEAFSVNFCFNLANANLQPSGPDSELPYFCRFYDHSSQVAPGVFEAVNELEVQQSGTWQIARGRDRKIVAGSTTEVESFFPCSEQGFTTSKNTITLNITKESVGLSSEIYDGSYITLETPADSLYGFDEQSALFTGQSASPGEIVLDLDSAFTINDKVLYRKLQLTWNGGTQDFSIPMVVETTMSYHCQAMLSDLLIHYSLHVMDVAPPTDEAPFNGDHQKKGCQQTAVFVDSGIWRHSTASDVGIIPHITRPGNGFNTQIILANTSSSPQFYELYPYTNDGQPLTAITGSLEPNESITQEVSLLLGSDEVSHFRYNALDSVQVVAIYQADLENAGPAHVNASSKQAVRWRIYPGNPSVTWDGIAVVNVGGVSSEVKIVQYSLSGEVVEQQVVNPALVPTARQLVVLSAQFQEPGAYYEVFSNVPLSVISLRGDHQNNYLWENQAIPLEAELNE